MNEIMKKPDSDETVVFIEYQNGLPFSVVTDGGTYDFERCGGDQGDIHCYNSGSGATPSGLIYVSGLCKPEPVRCAVWVAEGCGLTRRWGQREVPVTRKAILLKMGYEWLDGPLDVTQFLSDYDKKQGVTTCNPFVIGEEIYEGFVFCGVCGCFCIDDSESYCRHLFWSPVSSMVMGCGACEGCGADAHKDSFFKVLGKTHLAREIADAIRSGNYSHQYSGTMFGYDTYDLYLNGVNYGRRFTEDLTDELMEVMTDGVGWLDTLQPGVTKDAEKVMLDWIKEYEELVKDGRDNM